jgi:hypothetical protein
VSPDQLQTQPAPKYMHMHSNTAHAAPAPSSHLAVTQRARPMRKGGAEGTKSSRSMLAMRPATSSGISPRPPDAASWVISPLTQPTA